MNEKPSKWKVFTAGIIRENPVLRLVLGCCSALAVTTTVSGAVGMGLAMTFVLVCSNIVISALRKVIPAKVHLPCYIVIIATFLAGSQISVWLGGRIDEYGIGNGVSLLIFAGIVSRWSDINSIVTNVIGKVKAGEWLYSLIGILTAVAMLAAVWFVTYSDGAERRVPVQYAARTQRVRPAASYIPIKLLMSGVMPIIFAGVIMSLPATLDMFIDATKHQRLHAVLSVFTTESWLYCLLYVLLIAAFNFFYIEIQFDAVSMAGSLRKQGGTIPGIRPGTPTTDMLNKALHRMALTGSFYLAAIALTPMVFSAMSGVRISFGGTSLMILTGVALEVVRSIEGYMTVRHHKGFLE